MTPYPACRCALLLLLVVVTAGAAPGSVYAPRLTGVCAAGQCRELPYDHERGEWQTCQDLEPEEVGQGGGGAGGGVPSACGLTLWFTQLLVHHFQYALTQRVRRVHSRPVCAVL